MQVHVPSPAAYLTAPAASLGDIPLALALATPRPAARPAHGRLIAAHVKHEQGKKIKDLEHDLMQQTSLVVELRSSTSLPASELVAANINGPTRTALRSDAPFTTRRQLLGMIQEAHEAADETETLVARKLTAPFAAFATLLVLLVFVSCQSGTGEWLQRWGEYGGARTAGARKPVVGGGERWWGWRHKWSMLETQLTEVDAWL